MEKEIMKEITFSGDYGIETTKFFKDRVIREIFRRSDRKTVVTIFIPVNGTLEIFKEYTK